jgi:hypothetical protein
VNNNPGAECNRNNGRLQLLDHVKKFYLDNHSKSLTEQQLKAKVSGLLSHLRPGIIMPQKTRKGCISKSVGAPGACSKVEQDKANKRQNEKRKDQNDAENRKIIEDQGLGQDMRTKTETDDLCKHLLYEKKYPILGNQAMSKAIETNSHAIYIGTTKRALTEEDLPCSIPAQKNTAKARGSGPRFAHPCRCGLGPGLDREAQGPVGLQRPVRGAAVWGLGPRGH